MWSFGCIMTELFTGTPLFPSENEKDHMSMMLEVLGIPDKKLLEVSSFKLNFLAWSQKERFL
jgi:dual specificity tyrosine-phosphorylation-regulated kinase 2/3/4